MLVFLAILALGVLVIIHEAGHYFVARWSRMRVERFSLGFGPPILKWRSRETQFQLAPVPFGGFVQITGMNPHEEFDEKDPLVYPNRSAILRFLVILAGPAMNYVLAVVIMFVYYTAAGVTFAHARPVIQSVDSGKAAAGVLQEDDIVLAVNGREISSEKGNDLPSVVQKTQTAPILISVERHGKRLDLMVAPRFDAASSDYKIGVALNGERHHVSAAACASMAVAFPVQQSAAILQALGRMVRGQEKAELTGPVGMVHEMQKQFKMGADVAFSLIALLSVMLGLFNLLPVPGLDGGRLAFLVYELATRRRPNPKVEATVHMFGILVLFLVLIAVTFKDISNLFG